MQSRFRQTEAEYSLLAKELTPFMCYVEVLQPHRRHTVVALCPKRCCYGWCLLSLAKHNRYRRPEHFFCFCISFVSLVRLPLGFNDRIVTSDGWNSHSVLDSRAYSGLFRAPRFGLVEELARSVRTKRTSSPPSPAWPVANTFCVLFIAVPYGLFAVVWGKRHTLEVRWSWWQQHSIFWPAVSTYVAPESSLGFDSVNLSADPQYKVKMFSSERKGIMWPKIGWRRTRKPWRNGCTRVSGTPLVALAVIFEPCS